MKKMRNLKSFTLAVSVASVLGLASLTPAAAQSASFGFEGLTIGETTTLFGVTPDVGGGITATFSVGGMVENVDAFYIADNLDVTAPPAIFTNMNNNILLDGNGASLGNDPLNIAFDRMVTTMIFDVGAFEQATVNFLTNQGDGGSIVLAQAVDYFEGHGGLAGVNPFTSIEFWLSDVDPNVPSTFWGIDNIHVRYQQEVPEPGTLALLVALAVPAGLVIRRRK